MWSWEKRASRRLCACVGKRAGREGWRVEDEGGSEREVESFEMNEMRGKRRGR